MPFHPMQYRFISSNIFYLLEFSFDSRYWYSTPRNILWGEYSSGRRVSEIHVTSFCRYGMLYINQVRCIASLLLSFLLSFSLCIFLSFIYVDLFLSIFFSLFLSSFLSFFLSLCLFKSALIIYHHLFLQIEKSCSVNVS